MENKIVAIIQARLTSTRFPKKILEKINHLTLIEFLVKRVKTSKKINQVIVAIPDNKENRILKNFSCLNAIQHCHHKYIKQPYLKLSA